jgi:hypothetical protein
MKREIVPLVRVPDALKPNSSKRPLIQTLDAAGQGLQKGRTERSIFHEPWWLSATMGDDWDMAVVKTGDDVIAELPYALSRKGLWRVSYLPPLTRTLGPVIKPKPDRGTGSDWSYRLQVTRELIAQLPKCAHFNQVVDPLVSDAEAAAFLMQGFKVSVQFTLKSGLGVDEETAWSRLDYKMRNRVRRSSEQCVISQIETADTFVDFYDANLCARHLSNVYGSTVMRRLLAEVLRRDAGTILGAYQSDGSLTAAVTLVWDRSNVYYLLSTRAASAHSGAVALLIWQALKVARERELELDFDGVSTEGILKFLASFGGHLMRRYVFERMSADFAIARGARAGSRNLANLIRRMDLRKMPLANGET